MAVLLLLLSSSDGNHINLLIHQQPTYSDVLPHLCEITQDYRVFGHKLLVVIPGSYLAFAGSIGVGTFSLNKGAEPVGPVRIHQAPVGSEKCRKGCSFSNSKLDIDLQSSYQSAYAYCHRLIV